MINVPLNIVLHKNQTLIDANPARFKAIEAGKRFGKSRWAAYAICKMAEKPNSLYWYIAPTYGMAKDIAWNTLKWLIPEKIIKRRLETELMIELWNNSRIVLKGADKEESLRGPGIDGGIMDEAAYVDGYIWPAIIRGQLAGSKGPFYFISSPNKKGRTWFTQLCEDFKRKQLAGDKDYAFWHFNIHDNPTLSPDEVQSVKDENTDDTWNLEYLAITPDNSGQLFSEFDYGRHVGPVSLKNPGYFCRGLDWGIGHPTVCLWANFDASRPLDANSNRVLIYDEYCKSDHLIEESAATIKLKSGATNFEWSVIDPSTYRRNSQTPRSDADEFARNGITCVRGDNKDRGYDITKMFFKKDLIQIDPKCHNLLTQLKNLQYGEKVNDDCTDALRYMLVRIHDVIYSSNIFENQPVAVPNRWSGCTCKADAYTCKVHPREMNIYDERLFPKRDTSPMGWVMEEVA